MVEEGIVEVSLSLVVGLDDNQQAAPPGTLIY